MIWADKIALCFVALALAFCGVLLSLDYASFPDAFGLDDVVDVGKIALKITIYLITPWWIVLRIIDFIAGGPERRSKKAIAP